MSKQSVIQSLEKSITQAKELVEAGAALERLRINRDFRTVVIGGYFEKEAIRLVHLKADPSMQSAASQESIIRQIDAIGAVSDYFRTVTMGAMQAMRSITSDEETLQELHAEGLAE